jgi:hypothetical protein
MKEAKKSAKTKVKKERDISEMFDDPVCPPEYDPDVLDEVFDYYQHRGETVEEVTARDPEEGRLYAEWLKKPENAEEGSVSEPKPARKGTRLKKKSSQATKDAKSHIVDMTDEFLGKSIIISGAKKPK